MFEDLETSVKLFKEGVETDSGFEYVFNCEETRFFDDDDNYSFDINADTDAQLKEIGSGYEIVSNGMRPFDEFTQTICPAYPKTSSPEGLEVPITNSFSFDLEDMMGYAKFNPDWKDKIHRLIKSGALMEFAISFTGEPQDDGTYKDVQLVGLSMIPARKRD